MHTAAADPQDSNEQGVPHLTEHLFRHEAGKLVSILTGIFGIERLQLAEDVVQESLVRALETWPYYGTPKNPAAWLMQTARNLALDVIRREKNFREKEPEVINHIEQRFGGGDEEASPMFEDEIKDGRLRLIFACCHPDIPLEAQTALALKTLCGFSPAEIAKAFLTSEAAIAKRLTRARQRIQEAGIPFEIPSGAELSSRLDGVLQIIYLLFSEGYKASSGDNLIRADLCYEAIRLGVLLTEHPKTTQPRSHALLSLMLLDTARLSSRTDTAGNILRLQEQDRSRWDHKLIGLGIYHLRESATGGELTEYHLQAGIASCHCSARDYASTDWATILRHYDQWIKMSDSPIVALNRAVAVAQVHGPAEGVRSMANIPGRRQLDDYYLTHAVLGDFDAQLHSYRTAAEHFRRAIALTEVSTERAFLKKRLHECESQGK